MPTPQSRIKAYLEATRKDRADDGRYTEQVFDYHLLCAVRLGLELGREAGPEERVYDHDLKDNGTPQFCNGFNSAITAKNQAIDDLIKSVG